MSEQADAIITEDDAIITVTFDRQKKLNAINTQMSAALWEATNTRPTARLALHGDHRQGALLHGRHRPDDHRRQPPWKPRDGTSPSGLELSP